MTHLTDRITIDPGQCGGRPCIRGMRIRVVDILDLFAAGLSADQVLEELPDLEMEDIKAALRYAARHMCPLIQIAARPLQLRTGLPCRHVRSCVSENPARRAKNLHANIPSIWIHSGKQAPLPEWHSPGRHDSRPIETHSPTTQ